MVRGIRIDGPITAVMADYVDRAVAVAEDQGAVLLVELDTPGGDLVSMQRIAGRMLNSKVPVIVWVGPRGAQAASAGTFIVLAAHAAGMAHNTTIGAASPVGAGGEDLPATESRKATEDMAAAARSYAARRGEKAAEWAEGAVRNAASASSEDALDLGLIDALADEPGAFLAEVDGLTVEVEGREVRLATEGADVVALPMTVAESFLARLVHPAVAVLLLTIGINGILLELSSPGVVPGIVGVTALALGLYSLGVLEANLVGLVFIGAAFVLFLLEVKAQTHGLLFAGGLGLFVVGAVLLFAGGPFPVPKGTIASLALFTSAFFGVVVLAAARALRRVPVTGEPALIGARGVVRKRLAPSGAVFVGGELWSARSDGDSHLAAGQPVVVVARRGRVLAVRPVDGARQGAARHVDPSARPPPNDEKES